MYQNKNDFQASAVIRGGQEAPDLSGVARFFQRSDGVLVTIQVTGLPAENPGGFFGLHIHGGSGCAGENFAAQYISRIEPCSGKSAA